jgi:hypothetical protein
MLLELAVVEQWTTVAAAALQPLVGQAWVSHGAWPVHRVPHRRQVTVADERGHRLCPPGAALLGERARRVLARAGLQRG